MIRSVLVRIGLRDVGSIPTIITTTKKCLGKVVYWPDCSGNEDRKGLLTMHTFPPNRRLAQLDLWGWFHKRSLCGYSTMVSASAFQAEDVGSIPITRSN